MDAQLTTLRPGFALILDPHRGEGRIPLLDVLMSGYAMSALKDPSRLAFDERRRQDASNLVRIFGIT